MQLVSKCNKYWCFQFVRKTVALDPLVAAIFMTVYFLWNMVLLGIYFFASNKLESSIKETECTRGSTLFMHIEQNEF